MAMVVAGLSVGVAAFCIEPARVRRSRSRDRHHQERRDEQASYGGSLPRVRIRSCQGKKPLSCKEHYVNINPPSSNRRRLMFIIDASILMALAAIITASSTLIWSIRRKP